MLITIIGGVIFVLTAYFVQLAHPSIVFKNADNAAFDIAKNIGGDIFSSIFLIGLIVGQFASGLSAQTSASRLLYAMGRDSVLPRKIFGKLSPRFRTPINNIVICGVVALLALKLDVTSSTSFINFGAFLAFTFVNLSVIFHYYLGKTGKRGARDFVLYFLFPMCGVIADLWLLTCLDNRAIILGLSWLTLGVLHLGWLTRGFRRNPPELHLAQAEA